MKGITIGNLHTWRDLKLILASKTIGTPSPKVSTIDIPGGDGALDLTAYFGETKYNNRPISYVFSTVIPSSEFPALFSRVQGAFHGQKLRIVDDDDPAHYYLGRITVSEWKADRTVGKLTIDCDCEPYKYKVQETVILHSFAGKNLFNCVSPPLATAYYTAVTSLATGVRVTSISQGQWRFAQFRIAPIKMLAGRTITLSCKATPSAGAASRLAMGYFKKPYNPILLTAYSAPDSNTMRFVVDGKYAEEYDYVGLWMYSSRDTDGTANSYVDYTDVQIELGNTATEYVPYDGTSKTVTITAVNSRKRTIPTLMTTADATVSMGEFSTALLADQEYHIPEMELKEGNNLFTVTGTGLCMIKYQEGSL